MQAQTNVDPTHGFYLEEHENSKLISGDWTYDNLSDGRTKVVVKVRVHTTGWNLGDWDQPGSMLHFQRSYNEVMTDIGPNTLNTDDDPNTYYKVERDGQNGAFHEFCDIWYTTDKIDQIKNSVTKYYIIGTNQGQKQHSCTIVVNYNGGIVTGVNDLQVQAVDVDETVYDLMGRKVVTPVSGSIYIKNHKKFIQR